MRRLLWIGILLILLAAAWLAVALYLPYRGFPAEGIYVDVPHGASRRSVARLLQQNGVIRSRVAFEALCRARPRQTLQAGEYFFDKRRNAFEVFQLLAEGRVFTKSITVPEGYTIFDIADLVEREGLTTRDAFLFSARDPTPVRDLAPTAPSVEGFLFPASYQFPRHPKPEEIIGAMTRRFREAWESLPEEARARNASRVGEVVTLASLVERETGVPEERSLVAGVFSNRLKRGLPLQCDPTVIYALRLAGRYDGTLATRDLQFHSPYNTYRRAGLPPGPIANPGEASLRAALDPPAVTYLFFVANAQGGHFFSTTLREHNQNVARYRRLLQMQTADRPSAETPERKPSPARPR
jgi:UPF0755 protein